MRISIRQIPRLLAIVILGTAFCSSVDAQWGTLKGQVILDGDIPKIPLLVRQGDPAAKDAAVCAAQDIPDEKLVVDSTTKGIANVFIYLGKKPTKIYPDLAEIKDKVVKFDQKGCRFVPHAMLVRTNQQVRVFSEDSIAHNTHTYPQKGSSENFIVSPNDRTGVLLKAMKLMERAPINVRCDIHPWMSAYWLVLDHPYAAITDANGNFEIEELPVGTHEFMIWQESSGWLEKKHSVVIEKGMNEQKPLKFTAAQFLK